MSAPMSTRAAAFAGAAALLLLTTVGCKEKKEAPQADLLKVGHHGSATSSSPEFLAAVQLRYAVVSVGFYNSFHHPRPDVMRRYAEAHVETYRTDLAGAVSFYLDGKTVSATPVPR